MKIVINPGYQELADFIKMLPQKFTQLGTIFHDGRNCVKEMKYQQRKFIVKRYKKPHIFQRIAYTFWRKSKAERAYLFSLKLNQLGIDTPIGIGYIEVRHSGLFDQGYFISEVCPDKSLATEALANNLTPPLINALAAFLVSLHRQGILHGDLNLTNILYHCDPSGEFKFTLIDTNRTKFKTNPSMNLCATNLCRLTHNRTLITEIARQYARLRQWDASHFQQQLIKALDKLEDKENLKRRLKQK